MIPYPSIPLPLQSLSGGISARVAQTEGQNGLLEMASRNPVIQRRVSVSWRLTLDQFQVFEEWFSETLDGGVLVFEFPEPVAGSPVNSPYRFIGGSYQAQRSIGVVDVTADLERMIVGQASAVSAPPVPPWNRITMDPAGSQVLDHSFNNALLTTQPGAGSTTLFQIFPPLIPDHYIPLGINHEGLGDVVITSESILAPPADTVPSFPPALPAPELPFSDQGLRLVDRLEMEGGNVRQTVQKLTTRKRYSCSWVFTLAELATFQEFFFNAVECGSRAFWVTLPIEGEHVPVIVRFLNGGYTEKPDGANRYLVTADMERQVNQTVTPPSWTPYGLYYKPTVVVTAHVKAVAGTFYVVNAPAGVTLNIHLPSTGDIEIGVLSVGLGNVRITRDPYILEVWPAPDTASGAILRPAFVLAETVLDLGTLSGDTAAGAIQKPGFSLKDVTLDVGTLSGDTAAGTLKPITLELLDVLKDLGTLSDDTASGTLRKPTFDLS